MIFKKHASPVLVRCILIFLIMAGIYFVMLPTDITHAATITVTTNADTIAVDGFCSLREAIRAANLNNAVNECKTGSSIQTDTITLANGAHYDLTITSTKEDASLNGDLDIVNDLPAIDLIIKVANDGTATIDASGIKDRVLQVLSGAKVQIIGVTISGGHGARDAILYGGGIYNEGTLTLNKSTVSNNTAYHGGGIYIINGETTLIASAVNANTAINGGGIYNYSGTLTIKKGTIIGGAGAGNSAGFSGGGIMNYDTLIIDSSTVSANSADSGGGIMSGGMTTIQNGSTIGGVGAGNSARMFGGGIYAAGKVTINSSTISSNSVEYYGGGIYDPLGGFTTVTDSKLLANTSTMRFGSAIYTNDISNAVRVTNSCIVNNGHIAFYSYSASQKATHNWWGSATGPGPVGPGIGDTVNTHVDTTGFLKAPILGCPWVKRSAITANKGFGDPSIPLNLLDTTLTITLTNTNIIPVRDIKFTDVLPSGLEATVAKAKPCGNDGVVNISNPPKIILTGGSLDANDGRPGGYDECHIEVQVRGIALGTQTNASFAVKRAGLPDGHSNPVSIRVVPAHTLSFRSFGNYDGWVLESTENSEVGGSYNAYYSTISIGDDEANKQYRSILSFDTSNLPDNAVIISAVLKIKKQGLKGVDPFLNHNGLTVDIRKPYFGNTLSLAARDFQDPSDKPAMGTFTNVPIDGWYSLAVHSKAYPYINTNGSTQFRLRFQRDDDNDNMADYMMFYSGNHAIETYRPLLIIIYYKP